MMKALTVRRKIQLGVLLLIIGILGSSFLSTGAALRRGENDPSAPLREFAGEFDHFRRTVASGLYASISVATDNSDVETALSKNDLPGAAKAFERLGEDIEKASPMDLIVLVTSRGEVVAMRDTNNSVASQVSSTRSFKDALQDVSIKDAIEYLGGEGYQVSAEPFYNHFGPREAKTTIAVLMIGRKLSSLVGEFVRENPSIYTLAVARQSQIFGINVAPEHRNTYETALANRLAGPGTAVLWSTNYDLFIRDIDACGGSCARVAQIAVFRSRSAIEGEQKKRLAETTLYLFLTALAALGGGWLLARWITRPIEHYVEATEALAKGGGDLTRRLDASTDDELGRLAGNLNEVFAQIGRLAREVKDKAFEVGSSSEEIRSASRALLDGAAEQASRVQSTGAATTEMSASIQQVASSAADANEIAKRTGGAVEDAVSRMTSIRDAVERAAQRMALLGETGKRIGTIVDTIHQIADQTSLLALNAAIEAAHAGEHGRGFTVVADAVGQLAQRVERSAKEIDELIGQSRAQTDEALQAMQAGKREVENGTKLIADSIAGIRRVLSVFDDTTAAVKEQALASDEIARNMEAVGRIAQDLLVTSRQAVAQGDRLTVIATSLEGAVSGFRVDGETTPKTHHHSPAIDTKKEPPLLRE